MELTDEVTIKQCLDGNIDVFGLIVEKYQKQVYSICYHIVGNFADAQDLTQDIFIKAYSNLASLREPLRFSSWLRSISINICKRWLQNRKDYLPLETIAQTDEELLDDPSPQEKMETDERYSFVMKAMDSISEKNRLVTVMYYIDDLSYQEIGDFLNLSGATVRSRLHRARKELKGELITMIEDTFKENRLPEGFADKIKSIILGNTTIQELINKFGIPDKYSYWDTSKKELPDSVDYDKLGISFATFGTEKIDEIRFEEDNNDYLYEGKIHIGSSLEEVISFFGEPSTIVTGKSVDWHTNKVLYKDTEGKIGECYIYYRDIGVRMFFLNYQVCALYLRTPGTTP
jgi:RNA polymerase sigma factor (sigma-70 family)